MDIKRCCSQASGKGPGEWFTGVVRIEALFDRADPARVSGASVTFDPGARTAWHTHPLGQTLIVTSGCGWAQRAGGPREEIQPGGLQFVVMTLIADAPTQQVDSKAGEAFGSPNCLGQRDVQCLCAQAGTKRGRRATPGSQRRCDIKNATCWGLGEMRRGGRAIIWMVSWRLGIDCALGKYRGTRSGR